MSQRCNRTPSGAPRKPSPRSSLLHADIDFKNVDLPPDEIKRKLGQLRLLPTIVVSSGHGLHAYWLLREAIIATPETIEQVEAVLRMLCDHVGGDRQVCEVSRLMRLPGSHNSKDGDWLDVEVLIERPNLRYELDEIEEWLAETSPLIRRKDEAPRSRKTPGSRSPRVSASSRRSMWSNA